MQALGLARCMSSPDLQQAGPLEAHLDSLDVSFRMLEVVDSHTFYHLEEHSVHGCTDTLPLVYFTTLHETEEGWAVVRWLAEHPAVPDFLLADSAQQTHVWIFKQDGNNLEVMVATRLQYPSRGLPNCKGQQRKARSLAAVGQVGIESAYSLCAFLTTPAAQRSLLDQSPPGWMTSGHRHWPHNWFRTGEDACACYRVSLMVSCFEDGGWQPVAGKTVRAGKLLMGMEFKRQLNGMRSLRVSAVFKTTDVGSLASLIFSDDCQRHLVANGGLQTVWYINSCTHMIRRVVPGYVVDACAKERPGLRSQLPGLARQRSRESFDDGQEPLSEDYIITVRKLGPASHAVCTWRADKPDDVHSPNTWTMWLLVQKGVDVELSLTHFPRHTKGVDSVYQAGLRSVAAAEHSLRLASGKTVSQQGEGLHGTAQLIAENVADLHLMLARDEGPSVLSEYASGVRGQLLHGWPSCFFRPALGLVNLCSCPNSLEGG